MKKLPRFIFSLALILALVGSGMFAFGRNTVFASFVVNTWQGYKLTSGLVGYWTFDGRDTNASTAYDRSGAGNDGTLAGGATVVIGRMGQGVDFDGVNDYLTVADANSLDLPVSHTLSVWIKPRTITDALIVSKGQCGVSYASYAIKIGQNDAVSPGIKIKYSIRNSNAVSAFNVSQTGAPQTDTWTHIVGTHDGTTMRLYINGILDNTATGDASAPYAINDLLQMGSDGDCGAGRRYMFNGSIDDLRVYNRTLSADEVKRLYLIGASMKMNTSKHYELTDGLMGLWTFDGNDVNWATGRIADLSLQGRYGAISGLATTTAPTVGKVGQAFDFDGIDDYVDVSSFPTLTDYTYAGWFRVGGFTNGLGNDGSGTYFIDRQTASQALASLKAIGNVYSNQYRCNDGTNLGALTGGAIRLGEWQQVVWGRSGSTNFLFVDGVKSTATVSCGAGLTPDIIRIGTHQSLTPGQFYDGLLDEFRVYDRALSDDEVKRLYLMGASLKTNVSHRDELTNGLISYWTFDGKDMTPNVRDVSGQGNHGGLQNQTSTTTAIGNIGQGLSFDGVDDEINTTTNYGNSSNLKILTVSAWFKTATASGKKILGLQNTQVGVPSDYDRQLWMGLDGKVRFGVYTSSINEVASTAVLNDDTWHNATGVLTGDSGEMTLYIDGVFQGSLGLGGAIYSSYVTSYWRIGAGSNAWTSGATGSFLGSLDDVRIYNRALSADEVKRLYLMGK